MFCYILAEEPVQDDCLVLELVWKEDVEEDVEQQDPFKPEFFRFEPILALTRILLRFRRFRLARLKYYPNTHCLVQWWCHRIV